MKDIKINSLNCAYQDRVIFQDFSAVFCAHQINVLLGESGLGKTTLLNCIVGLKTFEGIIENVPPKISYIFQDDRLIPDISIRQNLNFVLYNIYKKKQERNCKIEAMLKLLEIADVIDKLPTEISGGQKQRAAIARAFLFPSELLILDEAFKEMDGNLKKRMIKTFLSLWTADQRTVIMVTHNRKEAAMLADNILMIEGNPISSAQSVKVSGPKGELTRLPPDFFSCDLN